MGWCKLIPKNQPPQEELRSSFMHKSQKELFEIKLDFYRVQLVLLKFIMILLSSTKKESIFLQEIPAGFFSNILGLSPSGLRRT